jgi:hypothetical protein
MGRWKSWVWVSEAKHEVEVSIELRQDSPYDPAVPSPIPANLRSINLYQVSIRV